MAEDILRQIGTIARAYDSVANIHFRGINLTRGQYLYQVRISEHPGIIVNQLAELLNVDRTTAARSIQKLVKQRLIVKRPDPNNQKIKHLYVTPIGRQLAQQIEAENRASNQAALSGLDPAAQSMLAHLLRQVETNAHNEWRRTKNQERKQAK